MAGGGFTVREQEVIALRELQSALAALSQADSNLAQAQMKRHRADATFREATARQEAQRQRVEEARRQLDALLAPTRQAASSS